MAIIPTVAEALKSGPKWWNDYKYKMAGSVCPSMHICARSLAAGSHPGSHWANMKTDIEQNSILTKVPKLK